MMPGSIAAPQFATLEAALGHVFRDRELLNRALTHKSRAFEKIPRDPFDDNEQLEFLGDSILGFLVSERLVVECPQSPEGHLSKLKAHLVSAAHLYEVARALDLGAYLLLGRSEEMSGGRLKKALLANAIEALIAAMYLDAGIAPVRQFVVDRIMTNSGALQDPREAITDYKGALQELAQLKKLPHPHYQTVEERGPGQARIFTVQVQVGPQSTRAEGTSKKSAGQNAARRLIAQLSADGDVGEHFIQRKIPT